MASPVVRKSSKFLLQLTGAIALLFAVLFGPIVYTVSLRPYLLKRHLADRQFAEQLRDDCRNLLASTTIPPDNAFATIAPQAYPASIRSLGPTYVLVSASNVHVELCGGHDHYGVDYYAPGVPVDGQLVIDGLYRYRH